MLVFGLLEVPWWAILTVILLVTFYLHEIRNFDYFKKQGIPSLKPYIFIGSLMEIIKKGFPVAELETYAKFKKHGVYGEFMGTIPWMVVCDESMVSEILVKDFASFKNRIVMIEKNSILGLMLFNLEDNHWRRVRNEISPTFTAGKLKKMISQTNDCARSLVQAMCNEGKGGAELDIQGFSGAYSIDVIAITSFGVKVDCQKDRNNAYVTNAKRAFDLKFWFVLKIYFPKLTNMLSYFGVSMEPFDKSAFEFFHKIAKDVMDKRKSDEDKSRTDFLQLMLKAQRGEDIQDPDANEDHSEGLEKTNGMTTDEILSNAGMFFAAGYETTATALGFLMYSMATNPECQEKLVEEIDRVVGDKEIIDYNMLQEMPYLDMCINENNRLYPSALRLNRVAKRDVTKNGVFIRKGMVVQVPIFAIHMDPDKWPEPEKFDPERFSPENKLGRNPFHFLPFGYGPRNCIGMRLALQNLKIAIAKLLQKVTLKPCERTQIPMVFAKLHLLKPEGGIWLKIEERNTA